MINTELLKIAKKRFEDKNQFSDWDYRESMSNFIIMMYLNCDPASYGRQFVKKIMWDESDKLRINNLYNVKDSDDIGDIMQIYPGHKDTHPKYMLTNVVKENCSVNKSYEVKISYLTKTGNYNIRNIRPYQKFDYFILCFVDCECGFNPTFIVVEKKVIVEYSWCFKLTPMNGTKESNKNNTNIGYGTSFKKYSQKEDILQNYNLLQGTTYQNLLDFLGDNKKKLKEEFEIELDEYVKSIAA